MTTAKSYFSCKNIGLKVPKDEHSGTSINLIRLNTTDTSATVPSIIVNTVILTIRKVTLHVLRMQIGKLSFPAAESQPGTIFNTIFLFCLMSLVKHSYQVHLSNLIARLFKSFCKKQSISL